MRKRKHSPEFREQAVKQTRRPDNQTETYQPVWESLTGPSKGSVDFAARGAMGKSGKIYLEDENEIPIA